MRSNTWAHWLERTSPRPNGRVVYDHVGHCRRDPDRDKAEQDLQEHNERQARRDAGKARGE